MILNVDYKQANGYTGNDDIDLGELYDLDWVIDQPTMKNAIMVAVANLAIQEEISFDAIVPDYVQDEDSETLSIKTDAWLTELSQFVWHLFSVDSDEEEHKKYFAYIHNTGWEFFDFDRLSKIEDDFYGVEEDLDPEDYAKEQMEGRGEALPEHLESHFDYQAYGEELLEDFNQIEWGDRMYLFTE